MPSHEIFSDGIRYVASKVAAKNVGLVPDYISRMCRSGHVRARRHAGMWYVDENSLADFLRAQAAEYEEFNRRKSEAAKAFLTNAPEKMRSKLTVHPHAVLREYTARISKRRARHARIIQTVMAPVLILCMLASSGFAFELMAPPGSAERLALRQALGRMSAIAQTTGMAAHDQLAAASSLPFIDSLATKVFKTICPYLGSCTKTQPLDAYLAANDPEIKQTAPAPKTAMKVPPTTRTASAPPVQPQSTIINNPVIERVRETVRTITEPGANTAYIDARIAALSQSLLAQVASVGSMSRTEDENISRSLGLVAEDSNEPLTDADIPDTVTASNYLPLSGGTLTGSLTGTNLTLSGTLTAGALAVSGVSSGGAITAPYFTATSTSASSTFTNFNVTNSTTTNATTTNLFATNAMMTSATTSNFAITGITSSLLKTDSSGTVIPAVAGTDYAAASSIFGKSWEVSGGFLSPTTTMYVTNIQQASSTLFSANWAKFGATASTTIGTDGAITTPANLTLSGSAANIILGSNYLSGDGGDEGIIVNSSGQVGVGQSSPDTALDVVGNFEVAASASASKSYRFRTNGSALDFDAAGADMVLSVYSGNSYTGTQRYYLGLESDSHLAQTHGTWKFLSGNSGYDTGSTVMIIDAASSGYVGIGTTSPWRTLSVTGNSDLGNNALAGYFTATTSNASVFPYASTTAITVSTLASTSQLVASNSFTFKNVTGFLKATAGVVATAAIDLASDITGILGVSNGGTGWGNIAANTVVLGNGTGSLATTTAGTNGQVLALVGGVPSWVATTTLSTISGTLAVSSGGTGATTFTNNRLLTGNGTSALVDEANLTFDGSTLSVSGDTSITGTYYSSNNRSFEGRDGSAAFPSYSFNSSAETGMWSPSAGVLAFSSSGVEGLRISTTQKVGIGTTTPYSKLTIWGSDTSSGTNSLLVSSSASTTLFAVNNAGHCVTGDSRLTRRRRKKKGEHADEEKGEWEDDDYIYSTLRVDEVQGGEEIASLDEKTGTIVWSRINKLMFMGNKPIYKITTAGGKTIRTTAEHPYLVRQNKDAKINPSGGEGNLGPAHSNSGVGGSLQGDKGAHLLQRKVAAGTTPDPVSGKAADARVRGISRTYAFIDLANVYRSAESEGWTVDYGKMRKYLIERYGVTRAFVFGGASNRPDRVQLHEHLVRLGYQVLLVPTRTFSDGTSKADVDSRMTFEMMRLEKEYDRAIVFTGDGDFYWVLEYLRAKKERVWLFGMAKRTARDLKRLFRSDFSNISDMRRAVALEDLGGAKTQEAETTRISASPAAYPFDVYAADVWQSYAKADDESMKPGEGVWTKVAEMREGMMIAVVGKGGAASGRAESAVWDRIATIEKLPREDVWDLEIEGTHNFVANGIIAHNTYIGGNAGVGTTTPWGKLSVTNTGSGPSFVVEDSTSPDSTPFIIDASGSVGIGVASPSITVDVAGSIGTNGGYGIMRQNPSAFQTYQGGLFTWVSSNDAYTGTVDTGLSRLAAAKVAIGNGTAADVSGTLIAGSIGIGTTSPSTLLSLAGTSGLFASTTATSTFQGGGVNLLTAAGNTGCFAVNGTCLSNTASGIVGSGTTGQFPYYAANGTTLTATSTIFVSTASNVGIGIASPSYKLQVETPPSGIGAAFRTTAGTNNPGLFITTTEATGITDLNASGSTATYGLSLSTGSTERVRINSSGNVGIGTTTPPYLLTVGAGGDAAGQASTALYVSSAGATNLAIRDSSGNAELMNYVSDALGGLAGTFTSHPYTIRTANADRVTVTAAGNVGIGTSTPASKLDIGNGAIRFSGSAPVFGAGLDPGIYGGGAANSYLQFVTNGGDRVRIDSSGNVGIGTAAPTAKLSIGSTGVNTLPTNTQIWVSGAGGTHATDLQGRISVGVDTNQDYGAFMGTINPDGVTPVAIYGVRHAGIDRSSIAVNGGTGNVGIGTTTPVNTLEVAGTGAAPSTSGNSANGIFRISGTSVTKGIDFGVVSGSTPTGYTWMQVRDRTDYSQTYNLAINPNGGNVGIGTTTPNNALTVYNTSNVVSAFGQSGGAVGIGVLNSATPFIQGYTNTMVNATANLALQVSGGNVGIGTTTPNAKLQVHGSSADITAAAPLATGHSIFRVTSSNTAALDFGSQSSSPYGMWLQARDYTNGTTNYPLLLNPNGGNVGIGTTSPRSALHVEAAALSAFTGTSVGALRVNNTSSSNQYTALDFGSGAAVSASVNPLARIASQVTSSGSYLHFGTSNLYSSGITNTAMTIDYSGNVGIGTTTPDGKFTIDTGTSARASFDISNPAGHTIQQSHYITLTGAGAGPRKVLSAIQNLVGSTDSSNYQGSLAFLTTPSAGSPTERMRINESGNVGIGTTSPPYPLTVYGNVATPGIIARLWNDATAPTSLQFLSARGGSRDWQIASNRGEVGDFGIFNATDGIMPLQINNSGNIILAASAGNVGIGTTTPGTTVTGALEKLSVYGNGIIINDVNTVSTMMGGFNQAQSFIGTYSNHPLNIRTNNATRMYLDTSGNVGIGTTNPTQPSYTSPPTFSGKILSLTSTGATQPVFDGSSIHMMFVDNDAASGQKIMELTYSNGGLLFAQNNDANSAVLYNLLKLDGTSGNIGVGTASPNYQLANNSASNNLDSGSTGLSTASSINWANNGSGYGIGLYNASTNSDANGLLVKIAGTAATNKIFSLDTGSSQTGAGTNVLTVLGSGNVGIGTTTPGNLLTLAGATTPALRIDASNTSSYEALSFYSAGTQKSYLLSPGSAFSTTDRQGDLELVSNSNDISFWPGGTQAVTMKSTGNVGIGTTSPAIRSAAGRTFLTIQGASERGVLELASGSSDADGAAVGQIQFVDRLNTTGEMGVAAINSSLSGSTANARGGVLSFFTRADNVGSGGLSEKMRIDSSGNVGIGTTTPSGTLAVSGSSSSFLKQLVLQNTSTGGSQVELQSSVGSEGISLLWDNNNAVGILRSGTGYPLSFRTNGNNERMRITSDGNVGIGTTSPTSLLSVSSNLTNGTINILQRIAGQTMSSVVSGGAMLTQYETAAATWGAIGGYSNGAGGGIGIWKATGNGSNVSGAPDLYVNNSGNVGIGTTTPLYLLEVAGNTTGGVNGQYPALRISNASASTHSIAKVLVTSNNLAQQTMLLSTISGSSPAMITGAPTEDAGFVGSLSNNGFGVFTNGTLRQWITASGNVGIGTTSPAMKLTVTADGNGAFRVDGIAGTYPEVQFSNASTYSGSLGLVTTADAIVTGSVANDIALRSQSNLLFSTGGATERMRITSTGNVGIGTTSPNALLNVYAGASGLAPFAGSTIASERNGANYLSLLANSTNESGLFFGNVNSNIDVGIIANNGGGRGLQFRTGGNNIRATIDSSGNVGIGTTTPWKLFSVESGTAIFTGVTSYTSGLTDSSIYARSTSPAISLFDTAASTGYMVTATGAGSLQFHTASDGSGATTARVTFDSSGLVGIGSSTPTVLLSVDASAVNGQGVTIKGPGISDRDLTILDTNTGATDRYFGVYVSNANSTNDNEFSFRNDGQAYADQNWNSGGADYAEYVMPKPGTSPTDYPKGSLICLKTSDPDTYGFCDAANDSHVVGIVSTNPAIVGNSPALNLGESPREQNHILLSMLGRVPLRVNLEGGAIAIGDRLSASSQPGFAMKATETARTVGFALEAYDGSASSPAKVMAYIEPELTFADVEIGALGELVGFASASTTAGAENVESQTLPTEGSFMDGFLKNLYGKLIAWLGDAENGIQDLFAKNLHAENIIADRGTFTELCVGSVCVTEEQFMSVFGGGGGSAAAASQPAAASGASGGSPSSVPEPQPQTTSTSGVIEPAGEVSATTPAEVEPPPAAETPTENPPVEEAPAAEPPAESPAPDSIQPSPAPENPPPADAPASE